MKERKVSNEAFKIICSEMQPKVSRDFEGLKPLLQLNTVEGSKLRFVNMDKEKLLGAVAENKTADQTYYFHSNKWPLKNLHVETHPEIKAAINPDKLSPHSTAIIHLQFNPSEILEKYGHIGFPLTVEYETPYTFLVEPSPSEISAFKKPTVETQLTFAKRMWRKRGFKLVSRSEVKDGMYEGRRVAASVTQDGDMIAINREVRKE